ncbi:hypothetical protein FQN50_005047 [Emmonsiellopsis sp. PD_5]|nr:hypothetical protein FQN50_005047 [Emmonsiellopsis sp. PD_5]
MFPGLQPSLNGGANRPARRTSTPQYVYSDQESDSESEPEASKYQTRSSLLKKEGRIQTRATTKPVSESNDAPKRKASTESGGGSRPEPPKLARTASHSHPGLRSLSDVTPATTAPTPMTNRGVSVDSTSGKVNMAPPPTTNGGASTNGHQLPWKSLSSASKLDQLLDTDILFILNQAKKCSSETKRADNMAARERAANDALRRCREENEKMIKTLKKEHEEELKKTTEGLEKLIAELHDAKEEKKKKQFGPCEKCTASASNSTSNTTSTSAIKKMEPDPLLQKLVEQVAQVKEAFTKIKTGSSMIINSELWKSHGMEAAAALGETTLDEINEALGKLQKGREA